MPELPEVETVRRMLEAHVRGRTIARARISGARLRGRVPRELPARLRGRTIERLARHGKYLLFVLDRDTSLISHLGMSGRWLYYAEPPRSALPHLHLRIRFADGSTLWYQDPRRFGTLRAVDTAGVFGTPELEGLGPDPVLTPPEGADLFTRSRGLTLAVKNFLLDQRRIAGVGNIYASEVLFRSGVDPRRAAGRVTRAQWERIAPEIRAVLGEAIERMGTTFSMYRTLWNEPGTYGDQLRVYDRHRLPCRACGTPIRRIVQGQRSTFFCPRCQRSRPVPDNG